MYVCGGKLLFILSFGRCLGTVLAALTGKAASIAGASWGSMSGSPNEVLAPAVMKEAGQASDQLGSQQQPSH